MNEKDYNELELSNNENYFSDNKNESYRGNVDAIPDYAFFLSYGEKEGYIPVGVFAFSGFVDENHQPIVGKYPKDISKIYVELMELDGDFSGLQIKPDYETIYIPLLKFSNLIEKHADVNHNRLINMVDNGPLFDNRLITHELMAAFQNMVSKYLINSMIAHKEINFTGESLEDVDATLVSSDGEDRVTNYTIMPFSLGKFKAKILTKKLGWDHKINPYGMYDYIEDEEQVHSRGR